MSQSVNEGLAVGDLDLDPVEITYNGELIASLDDETTSCILKTGGKRCAYDINVRYTAPESLLNPNKIIINFTGEHENYISCESAGGFICNNSASFALPLNQEQPYYVFSVPPSGEPGDPTTPSILLSINPWDYTYSITSSDATVNYDSVLGLWTILKESATSDPITGETITINVTETTQSNQSI